MNAIAWCRTIGPLAAAGLFVFAIQAAAAPPSCAVADDYFVDEPPLPHTVAALTAGKTVTVVAIGGASTQGRAAENPEMAWPARMAAALAARFPGAKVNAINRGVSRHTAEDMLARFGREVLPARPDLVVWETGTTDAVRGVDIDAFRATLQAGIDMVHAARIELILMDMQFSQRSNAVINLDRYSAVMRDVADAADVPFFRRHDLMRAWAEGGVIDLEVSNPKQRKAIAARLYDCIGRAVAGLVVHGQSAATATPAAPPQH
jgi:lysophospholipase L1-like esterase